MKKKSLIIRCVCCGKEFKNIRKHPNAKYCSKKCYQHMQLQQQLERKNIAKELNLCVCCQREKNNIKTVYCSKCMITQREYSRNYYLKKKKK